MKCIWMLYKIGLKKLPSSLDKKDTLIAAGILKEIDDRISF